MTGIEAYGAAGFAPAVQGASAAGLAANAAAAQDPPLHGAAFGASFGAMVSQGLAAVNGQLLAGQSALQELAVGQVQSLHQIMMQLEETRLSFQLVMQVRNRLLEAYQDVMKMQV